MRILAVGNMYPPHHLGGYELAWRDANAVLRARAHALRVLTTDHREPDVRGEEEPDVHRDLRWYWHAHEFPRRSLRETLALERHNARVMREHLDSFRPEVAAFWSMGGMSLALIAQAARSGVPSVCVVHDDWLLYGPRVDAATRLRRRLRLPGGFRPRQVRAWIFNSEFTRGRAAAAVSLRDARVAHPGIDLDLFREVPAAEWSWRLLYAGRIDARKGIDAAVRALASLPEATLEVIGGGDERHLAELRALAASLGVDARVRFGRVERERLPGVYAAADALAFPVRWDEPFGLVPLEAMAVGTPVVATGTGGSAEYLRDGENCLLVPREDDGSALAAAMRRLAADAGLRARLRAGGLETARRFPADALGAAVEDLCLRATRAGDP